MAGFNTNDDSASKHSYIYIQVKSRLHIKKFEIIFQEDKNPRVVNADFKGFDEFLFQSFKNNFSTEYRRVEL